MSKPRAGIKGFVDWIDHMQACCVSLDGQQVGLAGSLDGKSFQKLDWSGENVYHMVDRACVNGVLF